MSETFMSMEKDDLGKVCINIGDKVGWVVSDTFKQMFIQECKSHLNDNEFSDLFNPAIEEVIQTLSS